ncbi:MBL fold metallo-hydrolase [Salinibacterium sp. SYSU T00001]|uniref:MBL fold metallo-hydrolase n=1 Tax=Homoserinimonas sedimenticola TaxID=2986805 RepID=UPI002236131C|nr:MBL fold metallo-hydrolase [Salinibacterium sedimenticola]MCW4384931.1 MBL fold metallo-hydrolase [Salinibacterium sedimenticola]
MRIIKREHACLIVEDNGEQLVIDPGSFTAPLEGIDSLAGVVLTHEHPDHWTKEHLESLRSINPNAPIFGPAGVAAAIKGFDITVVADGDEVTPGSFSLSFHGKEHIVIHRSIPVIDNVGVFINDTLYYGGDSYTVPPKPVTVLAAPAGGPWLKIGEAMDFVAEVAPKHAFPTHQAPLSPIGQNMANQRLQAMTEQGGGTYHALEPGDTLEV